jgi:hypothetical protein
MMKKLMEEMANKDGKMSPEDKEAKVAVLKALKKVAGELMAEIMNEKMAPESMKQVTVAAADEEGLKEGLEKAEEVVEQLPEMEESEESEDEEMMAENDGEESDEDKLRNLLAKKQNA